jgi:hypothetical protein
VGCEARGRLYKVRVKYLEVPPGLAALLEEHRSAGG